MIMNGLMLAGMLCGGLNLASVCYLLIMTCIVLEKGLSEQECAT